MRQIVRICLLAFVAALFFRPAAAQISITVEFAPPALPDYDQPPCPEDGYIWVPGYWAWDADDYDYFWVPGTWIAAPETGYLWTPAWWGWENGAYLFHDGYWATSVGFYGGIVYGFGYFGHGFEGGRWEGEHFFYNRAVVNITTVNIHNVYNETVVNRVTVNHVSFNGGEGGIQDRPRPEELAVEHARHLPPVSAQTQHIQSARSNLQLRASTNQGRPPVAATARAGEFHGGVAAKAAGAPYHAPVRPSSGSTVAKPVGANPTHARDLQPHQAPAPQGNAPVNAKYQQQQQKLIEKQNQEHQKLQQQQEKEDQRAAQQQNQARQQQTEQRHAQQTQQMEQRHTQQQQRLESRQAPPPKEPARPR